MANQVRSEVRSGRGTRQRGATAPPDRGGRASRTPAGTVQGRDGGGGGGGGKAKSRRLGRGDLIGDGKIRREGGTDGGKGGGGGDGETNTTSTEDGSCAKTTSERVRN